MSTAAISIHGLVKSYGDFTAVDGITLDIYRGEIFALLGPNGAGKSTLLKLLATEIFPTNGKIELLSKTLGKVDVFELRTRIGV